MKNEGPPFPGKKPRSRLSPGVIAFIYSLVGGVWIVASDWIVNLAGEEPGTIMNLQTYKGWLYVLTTALMLYGLIRLYGNRLLRSQRQLAAMSRRTELILESAGEGVFGLDKTGNHTFINRYAAEALGYTVEELIGKNGHTLYHHSKPDGSPYPVEECPVSASYRDGADHAGEDVFWRKDGSSVPIEYASRPIFDDDTITGAVVTFRDITERKQAEATRAYLSAIVESTNVAIISLTKDLDGTIRTWNKGAERVYGYSAEEVVGRHISLLVPPDHPNDVAEILERIKRGEVVKGFETMRVRKDACRIHVSLDVSPIRDPDGTIIGASTVAQDITKRKRTEEALRESESRLQGIASTALDAVVLIDNDGNVTFWNDAATRMFGYTNADIAGKYLHSFIMPERHVDSFKKGFEWFRSTGKGPFIGKVYEIEAKRKDGTEFPVELSLAALKLKDSWSAVGIIRDITERKRSVEALRASEKQYRTLFNAIDEGFCIIEMIFDEHGRPADYRFLETNPSFEQQTGLSDAQGKRVRELAPGLEEDWFETYGRIALTGQPARFQNRAEQLKRWFDVYAFRFGRPEDRQVAILFNDITERRNMEEEIKHLAHHDSLTGLPNRRLFIDIANVEREQANRHRKKLGVLFLDLDRFKEVNDTLGHKAGDILLMDAASRIRAAVRRSDTIARIGGDEFNAILADIVRPEDIADIAVKIIEAFRKPFLIMGQHLHITTSIGISVYPDDSDEIDELLKYADIAMYDAKENGRNRFRFYNASINVRSLERIRMENMLQRSLEFGELVLYYQPLVDTVTRRVVSAEALVRWRHPERGLLEPKDFIPAAEETGFITAIDEWSLRTACTQVRRWIDAGNLPVCVTVNVSTRQFLDRDLAGKVSSILAETGVPPDCLDLEITETTAMTDVEQSAARLKELSGIGIHISIDDFGTGYSSLNYLKRLPIERLKIDRSFISDIPANPDDKTIVKAVTAMAHNMKMKVVAEGVETEEQLEFLRKTGCDEMQGFLFSEALPPDELEALVVGGW